MVMGLLYEIGRDFSRGAQRRDHGGREQRSTTSARRPWPLAGVTVTGTSDRLGVSCSLLGPRIPSSCRPPFDIGLLYFLRGEYFDFANSANPQFERFRSESMAFSTPRTDPGHDRRRCDSEPFPHSLKLRPQSMQTLR